MLKSIYEWNPQKSYEGYEKGKMTNMDNVAKFVLASGYKPKKSLKDYVITVIQMADYWDKQIPIPRRWHDETYSMFYEKNIKALLEGNFEKFDVNGHWELFAKEHGLIK